MALSNIVYIAGAYCRVLQAIILDSTWAPYVVTANHAIVDDLAVSSETLG